MHERKALMITEDKTRPVNDLLDQAVKNYEQAWKTGARLQEESARFFSNLMTQVTGPQDWSKRIKAMADEFVPQTQKTLDEGLKVMEQNSRASVELLKKAVSATQAATPQEAQTRLLGLWETSLNTMRESVTSFTQSQQKAMESWMACARKTAESAPTATTGAKA